MLNSVEKLLDRLSDPSENIAVIVEGKRDLQSLKKLGITNIFVINFYEDIFQLVEDIERKGYRKVVILTDFDRKGVVLYKKIRLILPVYGLTEVHTLRKLFRSFLNVVYVEEAYKRYIEIGGDIYGKDVHGFSKIHNKSKVRSKRSRRKTRRYRSYIRSDGRTSGRRSGAKRVAKGRKNRQD